MKDYKQTKITARGTDEAKLVTLIRTKALKGDGTEGNPVRIITQYWDFNGNLVAENYDGRKCGCTPNGIYSL